MSFKPLGVFALFLVMLLFPLTSVSAASSSPGPQSGSGPHHASARGYVPVPYTPKVTACSRLLCLDGKPWPLKAMSVYGSIDHPVEVLDLAAKAGVNTVRLVDFFPQKSTSAAVMSDEPSWVRLDLFLAEARMRGFHTILDLSEYRNLLAREGLNPYVQDWLPFLLKVTSRVNTFTGVAYKDDPAIAVFSLAGEPDPPFGALAPATPTGVQLLEFYRHNLHFLHVLAPGVLASSGGLIQLDWDSGVPWREIYALPGNDVCMVHAYGPRVLTQVLPDVSAVCLAVGKPWLVEEFGLPASAGDYRRGTWMRKVFTLSKRLHASGVGLWNLGFETSSRTFDVNPSFPAAWSSLTRSFGSFTVHRPLPPV